ncbi:DUF5818 domain-containing protein [Sphingomonas hengshuiensis]|nr:DUF5818 domain-containing protein [Sphingomonas hengshuiensis]
MGTRHRVTRILKDSRRGLILEIADGDVYALDCERDARKHLGQKVTVEGIRSGFDRIDVEWIGAA